MEGLVTRMKSHYKSCVLQGRDDSEPGTCGNEDEEIDGDESMNIQIYMVCRLVILPVQSAFNPNSNVSKRPASSMSSDSVSSDSTSRGQDITKKQKSKPSTPMQSMGNFVVKTTKQ